MATTTSKGERAARGCCRSHCPPLDLGPGGDKGPPPPRRTKASPSPWHNAPGVGGWQTAPLNSPPLHPYRDAQGGMVWGGGGGGGGLQGTNEPVGVLSHPSTMSGTLGTSPAASHAKGTPAFPAPPLPSPREKYF